MIHSTRLTFIAFQRLILADSRHQQQQLIHAFTSELHIYSVVPAVIFCVHPVDSKIFRHIYLNVTRWKTNAKTTKT